jgi:predicted HAD superfamily phosphohydrolase YqeG
METGAASLTRRIVTPRSLQVKPPSLSFTSVRALVFDLDGTLVETVSA